MYYIILFVPHCDPLRPIFTLALTAKADLLLNYSSLHPTVITLIYTGRKESQAALNDAMKMLVASLDDEHLLSSIPQPTVSKTILFSLIHQISSSDVGIRTLIHHSIVLKGLSVCSLRGSTHATYVLISLIQRSTEVSRRLDLLELVEGWMDIIHTHCNNSYHPLDSPSDLIPAVHVYAHAISVVRPYL